MATKVTNGWVTETTESEAVDKGELQYKRIWCISPLPGVDIASH